jgi:hypothetical protein
MFKGISFQQIANNTVILPVFLFPCITSLDLIPQFSDNLTCRKGSQRNNHNLDHFAIRRPTGIGTHTCLVLNQVKFAMSLWNPVAKGAKTDSID